MKKTPKRLKQIEAIISKVSGISIANLRSHSRKREYTEARMAVWFLAHDHIRMPYRAVAEIYDRDHTTIIHGANKIRNNKEVNTKLIGGIEKLGPGIFQAEKVAGMRTIDEWEF
jgi:chromosomal replication initiator protein